MVIQYIVAISCFVLQSQRTAAGAAAIMFTLTLSLLIYVIIRLPWVEWKYNVMHAGLYSFSTWTFLSAFFGAVYDEDTGSNMLVGYVSLVVFRFVNMKSICTVTGSSCSSWVPSSSIALAAFVFFFLGCAHFK